MTQTKKSAELASANSDASEVSQNDAARFQSFLSRARSTVQSWPEWKQAAVRHGLSAENSAETCDSDGTSDTWT